MSATTAGMPRSAQQAYLPAPPAERTGIGLCLSGGGFRATLFHLGALRRLNELGLIGKLRTVSAVSGGSIAAAHLATVISRLPPASLSLIPDWDTLVAAPLHAFTSRNRRTRPILRRLLPWNWFHSSTGVEGLADEYKALTSILLTDLPQNPDFILCATDMAFGVNWTFGRNRVGDYQAGYAPTPASWPLARAVAASSCFPPVFNPLPAELEPSLYQGGAATPGTERDALVRGLRLTDGGDYDNMGLEPVWKNHAIILVSDGGAPFHPERDRSLIWRLGRYTAILDNQAHALRVRWLIAGFLAGQMQGAYWGIKSAPASYNPSAIGYSKTFATDVIARIRTDLDAFSEAEAAVLENHGYFLADVALLTHVPSLAGSPPPSQNPPHPEWMDELRAADALKDSGKRTIFGRSGF